MLPGLQSPWPFVSLPFHDTTCVFLCHVVFLLSVNTEPTHLALGVVVATWVSIL